MSLQPGSRLGVYEVTTPIGEGGMGQVYRATDTTLGRQVAITILPDALVMELVDGEDLSQRIARGAPADIGDHRSSPLDVFVASGFLLESPLRCSSHQPRICRW